MSTNWLKRRRLKPTYNFRRSSHAIRSDRITHVVYGLPYRMSRYGGFISHAYVIKVELWLSGLEGILTELGLDEGRRERGHV